MEPAIQPPTLDSDLPTTPNRSRRLVQFVLILLIGSLLLSAGFSYWLTGAPRSFTEPISLTIAPGSSVGQIADQAAAAGLVRSSLALYATLLLRYEPADLHAGTYVFNASADVFAVAAQLASKQTELDLVRITLPEGLRAEFMAELVASSSPTITATEYVTAAEGSEGYLFPETYLIPPTMTASALVDLQIDTFQEVYTDLATDAATSSLTENEVVTLASIVEREANDETSMRMVAGIFLNRLAIGMPLQADASIEYALDVPLNELRAGQLATELRELDSPYNTYLYAGLPPTPIGNPGRQALDAVLHPTPSDYFYYLTGNDGIFYYAKTLNEHNLNIARYLR
jgi:UPF0755 protein